MKSRKKSMKYLPILVLALILLVSVIAIGRSWRLALLPDEGANFGCATCHFSPGGGDARNAFGQDWEAIAIPAGDDYVPAIANKDSDGDGFANDEEFAAGTHPGNADSHPPVFTIEATPGINGRIIPSGSVEVNPGADQRFIITPDSGYHVRNVIVDGTSVGAVLLYTFTNVRSDHTIRVTFEINTYAIEALSGVNGSISPVDSVQVNHGANQQFTITPDEGYHIRNVIVDGTPVGAVSSYTFTNITSEHTIRATFEIDIYTVTATAGEHGSISPAGEVMVDHGSDQEFTITPDEGYLIEDVLVDGDSVLVDVVEGIYALVSVEADSSIIAIFVPDAIKGDVNSDGQLRSNDAILALRIVAGLLIPSDIQAWAADMNGNGTVRSNDAILILRKIAGLITP